MTNKLMELAERCEAAEGPDRELEMDIAEALGLTATNEFGDTVFIRRGSGFIPLRITASLDAAMTLVPGRYEWGVASTGEAECWCGDGKDIAIRAATPSLALCAAALRALASQKGLSDAKG